VISNDTRCRNHVVPYTQLAGDLANDRLPQFSFITPDTCHDGHDDPCSNGQPGGLVSADKWLSQQVPRLMGYLNRHNGLLLITLDENGVTDGPPFGCCSGGPGGVTPGFGGRVGMLALGPSLPRGKVVSTAYDHMSLLRTIEDAFGIDEHLNNAAQATAMADVLKPR
jgi:phospholipase C